MRVTVSDPLKVLFEGNVKEVILPGQDGEAAILDFHQPFLQALQSGYIKIRGQWQGPVVEKRIPIRKGIAKFLKNELEVLVESI